MTETHPVQMPVNPRVMARISSKVTKRAYEVYCVVWGKQEALITGNCRGGFGVFELVALLYASGFPQSEWKERFQEATEGLVDR